MIDVTAEARSAGQDEQEPVQAADHGLQGGGGHLRRPHLSSTPTRHSWLRERSNSARHCRCFRSKTKISGLSLKGNARFLWEVKPAARAPRNRLAAPVAALPCGISARSRPRGKDRDRARTRPGRPRQELPVHDASVRKTTGPAGRDSRSSAGSPRSGSRRTPASSGPVPVPGSTTAAVVTAPSRSRAPAAVTSAGPRAAQLSP